MSYLGRVAMRATGPGRSPRLTPSRGSDSPLARLDQRLNLPGFAAIADAFRVGGAPPGAADPAPIEIEGPVATSSDTSIHDIAPGPSVGARAAAPKFAPSSTGMHSPMASRSPGPVSRDEMRGVSASPSDRSGPVAASAAGGAQVSEPFAPAIPSASDRGRVASAELSPSRAAGVPVEHSDQSSPLTPDVRKAFERLDEWLRSKPGPRQATTERAAARAEADGVKAPAPRERAPRATARPFALPRPRAPEPPRLTIGRIEVEVVAPRPAPTQAPLPRETRAPRTAPAAASPAAPNLGVLTFGLRQR